VLALVEKTEFFEAMKACRDMRMTFTGHPAAGGLSALARRLKEYRRQAPSMADAVGKLGSPVPEVRQIAASTLTEAGDLGAIYLRKALGERPDAVAAEAAGLLARVRDGKTPPLVLARLKAGAKPQLHAALMRSLAKVIAETAPAELREAHSMALAAAGPRQVQWLNYFATVLVQRCSRSGEKLDELLSLPGAYEKLRAAAQAAELSSDPALASREHPYVTAFNLVVGYSDCLLWLRSGTGVKLNADGRVTEWQDQSPHENHARQGETGKWPRIGTLGADGRRFVKFDGADDHLILPEGFADFSKGVTVTVWAWPASRKKCARFVDLGNGQGADNVIFSRSDTSDDLAFQVYVGSRMGKAVAKGVIESGKWQHLAASQDQTGRVVLYRNGRKVGEASIPVAARAVVRKRNYIARSNWSGHEHYEGLMDDLRVFNRGLTAREVKLICGRSRARVTGE